ncbi:hypothetical protein [Amycolatopsis sp. H20-H5]|uniref:hypothetical protein n=1 Tax=Amycolatopsis sp. H20-H5 TaxID=3046309 RepID=UPI002DBA008B|nr:hypothetical protein [Amycolatopsis sp. H20-H5]MEC3977789.1 hypothetical protein [Amycolatopsis sp. H20-H5]
MSDIDFASRGAILGLTTGLSSPPESWVATLGDEFVDTSFSEQELVRTFGLIRVT